MSQQFHIHRKRKQCGRGEMLRSSSPPLGNWETELGFFSIVFRVRSKHTANKILQYWTGLRCFRIILSGKYLCLVAEVLPRVNLEAMT
jgi:hypothetical protein